VRYPPSRSYLTLRNNNNTRVHFLWYNITREKKNVVVFFEFLASGWRIKNKAKRRAKSDSWIDGILNVFARNDLKTFSIAEEPENSRDNKFDWLTIHDIYVVYIYKFTWRTLYYTF